MPRSMIPLLFVFAAAPLGASADDHSPACCRDMAHTMEVRPCIVCGQEGADCRVCKACAAARGECPHCRAAKGFDAIFNGKDLAGWAVMGEKTWSARDGVIACAGGADHGGWLRTEKEHEDFVLRLEYRFPSGKGNSGVFLRATEQGNPAFTGMEIQLLADAGKPPSKGSCAALYASLVPSKNTSRPGGEWNDLEITCKARALKIVHNGETVIDVPNLDDPAIPFQEKPLAERAKKGFLGLQDHKSGVEFRNVRVKTAGKNDQ